MQTDCVILGGGAGGLCAAAALGRRGLRVTVVERLPPRRQKAAGDRQRPLQPVQLGYAGRALRQGRTVCLNRCTPPRRRSEVAAFFSSLGLMTAVEDGPRLSAHNGRFRRARRAAHGLRALRPSPLLTDTEARRAVRPPAAAAGRCSWQMVRVFSPRTSSPRWVEAPRRRWARTARAHGSCPVARPRNHAALSRAGSAQMHPSRAQRVEGHPHTGQT